MTEIRTPLDGLDETLIERPSSNPWGTPTPMFTYLSGPAGSGKTTLIRNWAEEEPGLVLTATTGIASINIGQGMTINALLGYFDTKSLQDSYISGQLVARLGRLWKSGIRRIVIDEVSMLDADQLTYLVRAVEEVNGRGYVLDKHTEETPADMGLTLCGDFLQLMPVKAAFAFESPEWEKFAAATHTLTEIRRQADPDFIQALRDARRGDGLAALTYFSTRLVEHTDDHFDGPTILAKNESVDRYNQIRFDQVKSEVAWFPSSRWGKQRSEWGNPEKPAHTWGIPDRLPLKVGSLVMILANRRPPLSPMLYANGDLATVLEMTPDGHHCTVRLQRNGREVEVEYVHREVLIPCDSVRRKELRDLGQQDRIAEGGKWEITGAIDYLPVRLAWACTVHKSQGLSLDKVQMNIGDPFWKQSGMLYVGMSRARTADGLRIVGRAVTFVERCVVDPRLTSWL